MMMNRSYSLIFKSIPDSINIVNSSCSRNVIITSTMTKMVQPHTSTMNNQGHRYFGYKSTSIFNSSNNGNSNSNSNKYQSYLFGQCQQYTLMSRVQGSRSMSSILRPYAKYETNESADTIDPTDNVIIYQHERESLFKSIKYVLMGQCAASAVFPLITFVKGLDTKYTVLGLMFMAWSGTFYFIGKRLVSSMGARVYYNKKEQCIRVVYYGPDARVLRIPIDTIKSSLVSPDNPFILLEDNTMIILQNKALVNDELLSYVLSGQEYEHRVRTQEEREYREIMEANKEKVIANMQLDKEIENLEKELKDLDKHDQQQQQQSDKKKVE